jgi:hypothetical protein
MTEERENTVEFSFSSDGGAVSGHYDFRAAVRRLFSLFGYVDGTFKVTIEFHPEDEVEDEE